MNNHLHPIFREALSPFSPIDADNVKLGHALRESANDEHTLKRESSGTGLSDCARMVCRCSWCGPWREQSDDFMSTNLLSDARGHREDVANQQRCLPVVERVQADGGKSNG